MWDGVPALLKSWRNSVVRLTLAQVAQLTGITNRRSVSTIAAWESGRNGIDIDGLTQLDECYRADGTLVDLARGLGTPSALPARFEWAQ